MEIPVIRLSVVTNVVTKSVQNVFDTTDAAAEERLRLSLYGKFDESIRRDHLQVALRIGPDAAALITCPTVGAANRAHTGPPQEKVFPLDIYIIGDSKAKIRDLLRAEAIKVGLALASSRYCRTNKNQTLSDRFVLENVVATMEQIFLVVLDSPKDLLVLFKGYSAALEKLQGDYNSQLIADQQAEINPEYLKVVKKEIPERLEFIKSLFWHTVTRDIFHEERLARNFDSFGSYFAIYRVNFLHRFRGRKVPRPSKLVVTGFNSNMLNP